MYLIMEQNGSYLQLQNIRNSTCQKKKQSSEFMSAKFQAISYEEFKEQRAHRVDSDEVAHYQLPCLNLCLNLCENVF